MRKLNILIYNDKYEDIADKYLEENFGMKKGIKSRIFNEESIIAQYHYNTLKLKNKLKQGFFRINFLNIKHENLKNAIEENNKNHSLHFSEFSLLLPWPLLQPFCLLIFL